MAAVTVTPRRVRLANTHNALTRTRPLQGDATVGMAVFLNADEQWEVGAGVQLGVIIGIEDGNIDGVAGQNAEVLMMGIVAGFDAPPGTKVSYAAAADGSLIDNGTTEQVIGVGLNDGLLYVNPAL